MGPSLALAINSLGYDGLGRVLLSFALSAPLFADVPHAFRNSLGTLP